MYKATGNRIVSLNNSVASKDKWWEIVWQFYEKNMKDFQIKCCEPITTFRVDFDLFEIILEYQNLFCTYICPMSLYIYAYNTYT